ILDGAKLIATNLDPNCPTQNGIRPGCGAIVSFLEAATGVKAFSVGKPSQVMMRAARKELGLATSETIMIGDTMETDILGGVALGERGEADSGGGVGWGFPAGGVLPGGRGAEVPPRHAYAADLVVDSLADLDPECERIIDLLASNAPLLEPSHGTVIPALKPA